MVPSAFRHRQFRIFAIGNFIALNAMWMTRIAVGWHGWAITGSTAYVGLLAFLGLAPTLLTGPIFGALADRMEIRRAALISHCILTLTIATVLGLALLGLLTPLSLAGVAGMIGVIMSAQQPMRMSISPRLIPRADIGSAVPIMSISFNLSRFLGPLVAGALIGAFGVAATFAAALVANLPMLISLWLVRPRPAEGTTPDDQDSLMATLRSGAAYAWTTPIIRQALILASLFAVVTRGVAELFPAIADGLFERGAAGLGQMTAAAGVGAIIASARFVRNPVTVGADFPRLSQGAMIAGPVLAVVLVLSPLWTLTLLAAAGIGFCGAAVGIGLQSTIQLVLEDSMRARVMSLWLMVGIGGAALGAAVIGITAEIAGLRAALCGAAVLVLPITLWHLLSRNAAQRG